MWIRWLVTKGLNNENFKNLCVYIEWKNPWGKKAPIQVYKKSFGCFSKKKNLSVYPCVTVTSSFQINIGYIFFERVSLYRVYS